MIQENGFNVGKPKDDCPDCGKTLVRYCNPGVINTFQACPDCEDL